jgi:hypothetical protein
MAPAYDEDVLLAAADLVGRTGARGFEIGYLHDDVPADQAGWYAHARYQGARISAENHRGPAEAAEALARQLLTGARCKCRKLVALSDHGAVAHRTAQMVNGETWTAEQAAAAGQCRWTRYGKRWYSACDPPPVSR